MKRRQRKISPSENISAPPPSITHIYDMPLMEKNSCLRLWKYAWKLLIECKVGLKFAFLTLTFLPLYMCLRTFFQMVNGFLKYIHTYLYFHRKGNETCFYVHCYNIMIIRRNLRILSLNICSLFSIIIFSKNIFSYFFSCSRIFHPLWLPHFYKIKWN